MALGSHPGLRAADVDGFCGCHAAVHGQHHPEENTGSMNAKASPIIRKFFP
jgi:hypothetical protein